MIATEVLRSTLVEFIFLSSHKFAKAEPPVACIYTLNDEWPTSDNIDRATGLEHLSQSVGNRLPSLNLIVVIMLRKRSFHRRSEVRNLLALYRAALSIYTALASLGRYASARVECIIRKRTVTRDSHIYKCYVGLAWHRHVAKCRDVLNAHDERLIIRVAFSGNFDETKVQRQHATGLNLSTQSWRDTWNADVGSRHASACESSTIPSTLLSAGIASCRKLEWVELSGLNLL